LLGPLPAKTALEAEVTGRIDRDGYTIEKILYQSQPGHHVTANLYIPTTGTPPYPGVLLACGHSENGKAYPAYQAAATLLAKNGLVALCYDPISQGERIQLPAAPSYGTTTHTLLDLGALLVGRSTVWYELVDGMRGLDYLLSRPEVDKNKPIGLTGTSGGGTQTTFLMAADPRVGPAAPSCYLMTRLRKFETVGPADGCQWLPGEGAARIDHFDYCVMRADQPTLVLGATDDFFDIVVTRAAADETRRVFSALGKHAHFDFFEANSPHGFQQPHREAATRFMRKWLLADDRPVAETEFEPLEDKAIEVTRSGQVLDEFGEETTVAEMNLREAHRLAAERKKFWETGSPAERREAVRRTIGVRQSLPPFTVKTHGELQRDGYTIQKISLERDDEVPLPALLFLPKSQTEKLPAVIYADSRGKAVAVAERGELERLVRSGRLVLAVDLRGYGETRDRGSYHKNLNDEERTSILAMYLGRPLLGQRVEDIATCLDYLGKHERVDPQQIELVSVGRLGPVALHAAYLDDRIDRVVLRDAIRSWVDDVVARPLDAHLLAHVVPHALRQYDLADLETALGERAHRE
jgi:dienelactone hydrolase